MYSAKAPPVTPTPMTWAPGSRSVTPSPTAVTSPAPSMPARYGGCGPPANVPRACEMSTKLTPAAVTRIRTSPRPGLGTGASVIRHRSCGPFRDVCCRARMVAGILMTIGLPFDYRTTNKSWHGRSVRVKVNSIERQTSLETHTGGYSRQAAHLRPRHRPAHGAGPVLGAGLRGHLAQRPGPGHGYRLGQHLRLLRQ